MNFWQWLLGYSDEDIQYLNSINRKKGTNEKDWKNMPLGNPLPVVYLFSHRASKKIVSDGKKYHQDND